MNSNFFSRGPTFSKNDSKNSKINNIFTVRTDLFIPHSLIKHVLFLIVLLFTNIDIMFMCIFYIHLPLHNPDCFDVIILE